MTMQMEYFLELANFNNEFLEKVVQTERLKQAS